MEQLKQYIREVPDFPKPGILFYDISTLFQSPTGFGLALDYLTDYVKQVKAEKIVGIESRGFVLAGALADRLDLPFALARKAGKLPFTTITEEYALEYGTDRLEIHTDAVRKDERVLVIDDLIATGGTIKATCRLVERLGGTVAGIGAVIALPFLQFEKQLAGYDVKYLVRYDSE
jgi:adenine phosphoribosyltransferase